VDLQQGLFDYEKILSSFILLIRGGQLNIGDQIISVNGISMVGLPLSSCQTQIKVLHLFNINKNECKLILF
jgi:hypothetical protein